MIADCHANAATNIPQLDADTTTGTRSYEPKHSPSSNGVSTAVALPTSYPPMMDCNSIICLSRGSARPRGCRSGCVTPLFGVVPVTTQSVPHADST